MPVDRCGPFHRRMTVPLFDGVGLGGDLAGHAYGGREHVFFAHDKRGGVEAGQLETVAVGDGVGGAGFDAIATEDAAVVIDVVGFGVAFAGGDALFGGVLGGFNKDAVGGTGGGAEEAGDAFLESIFVALEDVGAAEALLQDGSASGAFAVGVIFDLGGLEDFPEGDAHALGDGRRVARDGHGTSIRNFVIYHGAGGAGLLTGVTGCD